MIDGGIRQAGCRLRVTVQLTDTITKTQLWVDTYERTFDPDKIFDIQDDLVVRIVSTCADPFGVIPRSIGEVVRGTHPTLWSPYEVLYGPWDVHMASALNCGDVKQGPKERQHSPDYIRVLGGI